MFSHGFLSGWLALSLIWADNKKKVALPMNGYIIENTRIVLKDKEGKIVAEADLAPWGEKAFAITHTFVDPSLRGQGIAAEMMALAAAKARREGLLIKPVCSYAGAYFEKHPELSDLLAKD
jgi:predicted GNAT family acetyltransferase